jgi:NIMA (never in mitosis gene a)-related kinase 1/4/5
MQDLNEEQQREALKEAKVMEVLSKHPNIVKFREVYKTRNGKLCIVMEYVDGGDLCDKIKARSKVQDFFNEDQILNWFT